MAASAWKTSSPPTSTATAAMISWRAADRRTTCGSTGIGQSERSVHVGVSVEGVEAAKRPMALWGTLGWFWTVFGPFLGLVLITLLFAYLTRDSGSFMTAYNWRTIAVQTVVVGTAALGMTLIMIAG